jgi:hypothetical protein
MNRRQPKESNPREYMRPATVQHVIDVINAVENLLAEDDEANFVFRRHEEGGREDLEMLRSVTLHHVGGYDRGQSLRFHSFVAYK